MYGYTGNENLERRKMNSLAIMCKTVSELKKTFTLLDLWGVKWCSSGEDGDARIKPSSAINFWEEECADIFFLFIDSKWNTISFSTNSKEYTEMLPSQQLTHATMSGCSITTFKRISDVRSMFPNVKGKGRFVVEFNYFNSPIAFKTKTEALKQFPKAQD